ncbi:MAG: hypothetical protein Q4F00_01870 [bacterium]|nr:hypothetical protein [bacterium]
MTQTIKDPHFDLSDLSDVPGCEKYIQPLLKCDPAIYKDQKELDSHLADMCTAMFNDGRDAKYAAKVGCLAHQKLWFLKEHAYDTSDVPECEKYIQPLLKCDPAIYKDQKEIDSRLADMCKAMFDDGRDAAYIAKVGCIAHQRIWALKENA